MVNRGVSSHASVFSSDFPRNYQAKQVNHISEKKELKVPYKQSFVLLLLFAIISDNLKSTIHFLLSPNKKDHDICSGDS